ncbi:MAG TPA: hypothetical protein VKU19_40145 [Bryobacteraceae bacterium]|nr:hypothetical protein [Bryobacteraceae bacterium]
MKNVACVLLACSAALFAADPQSKPVKDPAPDSNQGVVKKLGSVTWDLESHKLVWVVQSGTMVNGRFAALSEQKYEISPEEATMGVTGEKRGLNDIEAASLQRLLDVLSVYCAQSSVWWDAGLGDPIDEKPTGAPPQKQVTPPDAQKPVKVGEPSGRPARVPLQDNEIVARVRF